MLADVLPAYADLLRRDRDEERNQPPDAEPEDVVPPPDDGSDAETLSDEERKFLEHTAVPRPVEAWVVLHDEAAEPEREPERSKPPAVPTSARPIERDPTTPGPSATWIDGIVQRFRRAGRRTDSGRVYEEFNYVLAVRRLQPQIDAILYGSDGRDGLIGILNRRRFGTLDPWRRPRRRRRGDSGEIDADHPENLFLAPATAFLKGPRQRRDDSQKDFAHAILLDVSGSMTQHGYRSRKFDQLIDTLVVFCEIHQRLKLPYELIAFSDRPTVLRSFAECHYDNLQINPASAYVVADFSYVVREMYRLDHGETHETPALERAIADLGEQAGLETLFVVTDGISSERSADGATSRDRAAQSGSPRSRRADGRGIWARSGGKEFGLSRTDHAGWRTGALLLGPISSHDRRPAGIVCEAVNWRIRTA